MDLFRFANVQLRLVPDNLNKRQRWSKKFPIRLTLCAARQDGFVSKTTAGKGPRRTASKTSGNNPYEHTLMFLFAARSRDKMEWFYRMQMASDPSRGCPLLPSLQHDQADYIRYVPSSRKLILKSCTRHGVFPLADLRTLIGYKIL